MFVTIIFITILGLMQCFCKKTPSLYNTHKEHFYVGDPAYTLRRTELIKCNNDNCINAQEEQCVAYCNTTGSDKEHCADMCNMYTTEREDSVRYQELIFGDSLSYFNKTNTDNICAKDS
jgi:hypothetical protein